MIKSPFYRSLFFNSGLKFLIQSALYAMEIKVYDAYIIFLPVLGQLFVRKWPNLEDAATRNKQKMKGNFKGSSNS